jgi:hypothetical protein
MAMSIDRRFGEEGTEKELGCRVDGGSRVGADEWAGHDGPASW